MSRRRDRVSGLSTIEYRIVSRNLLNYRGNKGPLISVLNIELYCDLNWTPYCKVPSSMRSLQ